MKNLKDAKTIIYPSTTRGGKELPSISALDSPSVMSKLVTPKPASTIRSNMSHVIDDAASAMLDTCDETTSMPDNTMPLSEFIDEQIARAREKEIIESDYIDESDDEDRPIIPEGYVFYMESSAAILACTDLHELKRLLIKWNKESLKDKMRPDPAFATSPICVPDKDYEFSVDPDIITLVESDPFHGYESETVVAHLTKLNDIATLFTNDERSRYFYILKIFPFSLKGDAKIWFNSLDPGCVHSPQDMIYYFSAKYFPAHKKQAALREIYNFVQIKEESLPQAWGGFSSYLMLCLIILLRNLKYLISFIMD